MTIAGTHIDIDDARTLAGALKLRAGRSGNRLAYRDYDRSDETWRSYTWDEVTALAARWQAGLRKLGLARGDRVALMLRNCTSWVAFDQAALGLGLVTVPVYTNDRADNIAHILRESGARVLLIEDNEQWAEIRKTADALQGLAAVISLSPVDDTDSPVPLLHAPEWLPAAGRGFEVADADPNELATIVYTSGTTGRPKGVMLSHYNILWNIRAALQALPVTDEDELLSFLPLSHTFERTTGYYLTIVTGSAVTFARSISELAEDLVTFRPTILIAVPRIFERVYGRLQTKLREGSTVARALFAAAVRTGWRRFEYRQRRASWAPSLLLWPLWERLVAKKIQARLGGRLRFAVSGGAALAPEIAQTFVGLGITIIQGYGLTETSPVISGNRLEDNVPASVGRPLAGIEVKVDANDELLVRSPSVMLGYWNNAEATREVIDADGWLRTGDQVRIDEGGHIFITGRLKEIIVLANGEKVPPADMELAIVLDPLIEQVMVIGEGRPFLAALAVLNAEALADVARDLALEPADSEIYRHAALVEEVLGRIRRSLRNFPGYAQIYRVALVEEPWGIENDMLTPTLKLKRDRILERHRPMVGDLYAGH